MSSTIIDDRFELEENAASGGMGTVYRAVDLATGRTVAVKILLEMGTGDPHRFAREATILSQLSHPGIVRYIARGHLPDARPYLVMDWVEGETLDSRLDRCGLSVAETVDLGRQVAEALGHAHSRGVVHRDVKPTNLMFSSGGGGRVAVLDFGIARPVARVGSLTKTGVVIGTPAYMAPEQARGERDVDARADVFALGCVLYECLTGRLAFEGKRYLALTAKIVLWDPPAPRELNPAVPVELDRLVRRMLAKDPADRPGDGATLAALFAAIPTSGLSAGEPRRRQPAPPTVVLARPQRSSGPAPLAAFVVATPPELETSVAAPAAERLDEERAVLAAMLEPFGARLDVLADGSVLLCLAGSATPEALGLRAAQCALAVRRGLPDAVIGVAIGEVADAGALAGDGVQYLLDETVAALARDAMALVFAGVATAALPPGAIRVDERTAALVDRDYTIVRVQQGIYLRPPG